MRPRQDEDRKARSDRRPNAIEHGLTRSLLHSEQLVKRMDLRSDLFPVPKCTPPSARDGMALFKARQPPDVAPANLFVETGDMKP
jgi:hypothetical protein